MAKDSGRMCLAAKEMVKSLYVDGGEIYGAKLDMEFGNDWTHIESTSSN